MRRLYVPLGLLIMSLVMFQPAVAQGADNLLGNPGFESGLSLWTDKWGRPLDIEQATVRSGSLSASSTVIAETDGNGNPIDSWNESYDEADFAPGEPAYGSVYIKTAFPAQSTARAGLLIQCMDDSDAVLASVSSTPAIGATSADWRLVQATLPAAPAGTTKVRLSLWVWAAKSDASSVNGKAYFDDATLSKEYKPVPLPTQLSNPGFEEGMNMWDNPYGYSATLVTSPVHGGSFAVNESLTGFLPGQTGYWGEVDQVLACVPLQRVTASVYANTNFAVAAKAKTGLLVTFLDVNDRILKTAKTKTLSAVTNWTLLRVSRILAPTGTAKVKISLYLYAPQGDQPSVGAQAYFDDVTAILTAAPQ